LALHCRAAGAAAMAAAARRPRRPLHPRPRWQGRRFSSTLVCPPRGQAQGYSSHALFTDFTFDNIGVPRNWNIPANTPGSVSPIGGAPLLTVLTPVDVPDDAEYAYYDMGLCGPLQPSPGDVNARPNLAATTTLCGVFKVPTLRNVAMTPPYFHNGVFGNLHQVVEWYVTRDINNDTGNNPNPVAAGPGGNPYVAVGTFYTAANGTPDLYEYNEKQAQADLARAVFGIGYTFDSRTEFNSESEVEHGRNGLESRTDPPLGNHEVTCVPFDRYESTHCDTQSRYDVQACRHFQWSRPLLLG
jgi:cytochrome c peroxidase